MKQIIDESPKNNFKLVWLVFKVTFKDLDRKTCYFSTTDRKRGN